MVQWAEATEHAEGQPVARAAVMAPVTANGASDKEGKAQGEDSARGGNSRPALRTL
jgi:hypothetical protein